MLLVVFGDHHDLKLAVITTRARRPSPAAMLALIALTRRDIVLAWDVRNRTLIAANLVGKMPWTERD